MTPQEKLDEIPETFAEFSRLCSVQGWVRGILPSVLLECCDYHDVRRECSINTCPRLNRPTPAREVEG